MNRQLEAGESADETVRAAGQWQALSKLIGEREFPRVFAAWQAAKIDPAKPEGVVTTLEGLYPAKKAELAAWWGSAGPLLVEKREASGFARVQAKPGELSGKVTVVAGDDGKPDGKKSIAGSGHARVFAAPGPGRWYVRAVSVYGARYGRPQAPRRDFDLALCDKDLRPVASWKVPFSKFRYGREEWVRIEVEPTLVPEAFAVCVAFQPTATEGVFVSFDSSTTGHSLMGTPGNAGAEFKQGDWMIRVELDQLKSADALSGR